MLGQLAESPRRLALSSNKSLLSPGLQLGHGADTAFLNPRTWPWLGDPWQDPAGTDRSSRAPTKMKGLCQSGHLKAFSHGAAV